MSEAGVRGLEGGLGQHPPVRLDLGERPHPDRAGAASPDKDREAGGAPTPMAMPAWGCPPQALVWAVGTAAWRGLGQVHACTWVGVQRPGGGMLPPSPGTGGTEDRALASVPTTPDLGSLSSCT